MAKLVVKNKYGIIPNDILNSPDLSFKAKGLFGYIQSKPDDWDFSIDRIKFDTKESRNAVNSGLKELEDIGLLVREKYQDDKGYWQIRYTLFENPIAENRTKDFRTKENRETNKTRNTKKEISNKEINNKVIVATEVATLQNYIKKEFDNNFLSEVYNKYNLDEKLFKEECVSFLEYWTETNINGKKERWQKQKTFDPKLRFRKWMKNSKKWNSNLSFNKNKVCETVF